MKKLSKNITYWLGVATVGLIVGLSIQFVRAWTEPGAAPPGGNVGAPINTSNTGQSKEGNLLLNSSGTWANGLIVANGNVGIGTTSPTTKLDINGGLRIRGLLNCNTIDTDASGNLKCGTDETGAGGGVSGSGTANYLSKWTGGTSLGNSVIYDNGSVGIGTTSPGQKLDVAGYVKGQSGLCIGNDCRSSWPAGSGTVTEYNLETGSQGTPGWLASETLVLDMGAKTFCALSRVFQMNQTSDNKWSMCRIYRSGSNWILEASDNGGGMVAKCSAFCN